MPLQAASSSISVIAMMHSSQLKQFATLFSEGVESGEQAPQRDWQTHRQAAITEDFLLDLLRTGIDTVHLVGTGRLQAFRTAFKPAIASGQETAVPDPRFDEPDANGLVARAFDLNPGTLVDGYGRGLSLRWIAGRAVWWSPRYSFAGSPAELFEPAGCTGLISERKLRISLDRNFASVAGKCARRAVLRGAPLQPGRDGLEALARLHDAGFAHSLEIHDEADRLVGGCYGIASGKAFVTQACFGGSAAIADLAIIMLNRHLAYWDFAYHVLGPDVHAANAGMPRKERNEVRAILSGCLAGDKRGRWLAIPDLVA